MKRKKPFSFLYIILVLCFLLLFLYWQNFGLQTTRYTLDFDNLPAGFDGFRIVQLSDLHGMVFGYNNGTLVKRVEELNPDILILTGDMISSGARDGQPFIDFLNGIGNRYPIYMCLGNHEQIAEWYEDSSDADYGYNSFIIQVKKHGVHILDNQTETLEMNGDKINISGLTLELYHYSRRDSEYADDKLLLQTDYIKGVLGDYTGVFTILMAHNPSYFRQYVSWGADLTLAGHMHGGIIQVPFKGGLLSPEHIFFPEYDAGLFSEGSKHMIVNRGLGNSKVNFRLFNMPEITEITLKKK